MSSSIPATPAPAAPTEVPLTWKIEAKVIAATAATFAVSLVLAVLNTVQAHHELLGSVPAVLQSVIIAVIPTAVTFLSGYLVRHTSR